MFFHCMAVLKLPYSQHRMYFHICIVVRSYLENLLLLISCVACLCYLILTSARLLVTWLELQQNDAEISQTWPSMELLVCNTIPISNSSAGPTTNNSWVSWNTKSISATNSVRNYTEPFRRHISEKYLKHFFFWCFHWLLSISEDNTIALEYVGDK